MSLLNEVGQLFFLKDKELNQFYLAIFFMTFGGALINIFVPIYLFNLGYPIYRILFFYLLVSLYFVLFSYIVARIVSKIGEKHAILYSTPFLILYYLSLIYIESHPAFFFFIPLFLTVHLLFFNYGYHLNFINHSTRKYQGVALATVGVVTLVATVLAPYFGGLLAGVSFPLLFFISSILMLFGAIPLLFSRDTYEQLNFSPKKVFQKMFLKEKRGTLVSFSGYAIESVIGRVIWPIFLIIIIGSLSTTGLVVAASMILSLLMFSLVGKITDRVNRVRLLRFGTMLYFFAWVGRLFADTTLKIFFIDSYRNLSGKILHLPWEAHNYDLARRENYFEFIVSREVTFNLVRLAAYPVLILVFWLGFYPFLVSFLIAGIFSLGYLFVNE